MGIRRIFAAAALAMLIATTIAVPLPAFAEPPETTRTDCVEVNAFVANCGSFQIRANYTGTIKETLFTNSEGDLVRLLIQGRARGTLTNSVSGYSVKDAPSIRNTVVDLVKGTATHVGVDFHITVPGAGVVVLQAGRIVFEGDGPPIFVAGPHLGPPAESAAALCAALDH